MHCFPCTDQDWEAAKTTATAKGDVWSEELRKFVRRYAKSAPKS